MLLSVIPVFLIVKGAKWHDEEGIIGAIDKDDQPQGQGPEEGLYCRNCEGLCLINSSPSSQSP